MIAASFAVLLVSAVELRLEDARGVSTEDVRKIAEGLEAAIAQRSGKPVTVVRKSPCGRDPECVAQLMKEGGATDLVFIRLIGVPTRIRLIAERVGVEEKRSEVDLLRAKGSWPIVLGGVAEHLFPARPPPPPPISVAPPPPITAPPPPPPPEEETRYGPWILAGTGAAVVLAGVGFGFSSRQARSAAANEPHTAEELVDLEDRAVGHGIAANVMFGVGAAGLAAALIWWFVE